MQDFAQLEAIYGTAESKALISLCGTVVVGQTMIGDTAKALCDAFGAREVELRNVSTQGSDRGQSASVSFSREDDHCVFGASDEVEGAARPRRHL